MEGGLVKIGGFARAKTSTPQKERERERKKSEAQDTGYIEEKKLDNSTGWT